jgi:hypothetical protein
MLIFNILYCYAECVVPNFVLLNDVVPNAAVVVETSFSNFLVLFLKEKYGQQN